MVSLAGCLGIKPWSWRRSSTRTTTSPDVVASRWPISFVWLRDRSKFGSKTGKELEDTFFINVINILVLRNNCLTAKNELLSIVLGSPTKGVNFVREYSVHGKNILWFCLWTNIFRTGIFEPKTYDSYTSTVCINLDPTRSKRILYIAVVSVVIKHELLIFVSCIEKYLNKYSLSKSFSFFVLCYLYLAESLLYTTLNCCGRYITINESLRVLLYTQKERVRCQQFTSTPWHESQGFGSGSLSAESGYDRIDLGILVKIYTMAANNKFQCWGKIDGVLGDLNPLDGVSPSSTICGLHF